MFSFFSHKEKEGTTLILEIQSGLVRGAIVKNTYPKPEFLARHSAPITINTEKTSAYITKVMLRSLSEVTKVLTRKHYVDSVHIVLSSPWALSHSKQVKLNFAVDTAVNSTMVYRIVEEEKNNVKHKEDVIFIEKKIFEIKLNGYSVSNFEGRMTRELGVSFATTISSHKLLNKIHSTLERSFKVRKIQYHSSLLLDYIALGKIFTNRSDYIYVHSHSELTDIVIVRSGMCTHISSFPIGTASLMRKVAESTNQSDESADSLLNMVQRDTISKPEYTKLLPTLDIYFKEWFSHFESLVDKKTSPRFVYVASHAYLNVFRKRFEEVLGNEYTIHPFEPDTMELYSIALQDML